MNTPEIYIAISVVVLAVIAVFVIYIMKKKPRKQPSKSVLLTTLFTVFGIIFISIEKTIAYGFFGMAIVLGLIDIYRSIKKKKK